MDTDINNIQISSTKKWFTPKIIFIVLAVVLVVEVIFGLRSLISPMSPSSSPTTDSQTVTDGKVSLSSVSNTYKVGDTVSLSINLDTGGHKTAGSDVILHFDSKILDATDSSSITKGSIYSDYSKLEVDPKLGLVTISGVSGLNQSNFQGVGVLATLNFKSKAAGQTTITLDFKPGSTTDTNLTDATSGKDILGSVANLTLTIK